jgi:hypothetical protein
VICRLAYLHEAIEPKVVHRDIKSSNILIDEEFNGKLSDFGLAKLLGAGKSHITTRVMGTFGYVVCLLFFHLCSTLIETCHILVGKFTCQEFRFHVLGAIRFMELHMEKLSIFYFVTTSGMWPLNMQTQVC